MSSSSTSEAARDRAGGGAEGVAGAGADAGTDAETGADAGAGTGAGTEAGAGTGTPAGAGPAAVAAALRRGGVEADVSARRRAEYATDASLYRVVPTAVAFPRTAEEVAAALAVCRELGVPVTARGAGTSIAGNAVGTGLVLDFSRHMTTIHGIDPESRTAVVDPGVVLDDLQRAAAPYGLRFGPDPSTHGRCTLGGMIGNNACGSRALGYGRTADNVVALDVLTGSGERLTVRKGEGPGASPTLRELHDVVNARLGVIRTELGRFTRQVSGYSLEHLLPERDFDVASALVGSEGTLGVLLGATVRLVPAPAATALAVLGYEDMACAADDVPSVLPFSPVAIEGLDARIVDVVRRTRGAGEVPRVPRGGGWLFAEVGADSAAEAGERARALAAASGALETRVVTEAAEAAALWRIREDGAGLVTRGRPAHAGWEDAAVPPEGLGAYLREFEALLADHGLTGVPYGHFGDGCVHIRIDFPLQRADGKAVFAGFLEEAARLVARHGGSMSGEHGDGRARGALLPHMYSAAALDAFAAVKDVFDPGDLLNPGVIVRPRPVEADLRLPAAKPYRKDLAFAYAADDGDFGRAVHRCTGVGKCRTQQPPRGSGGVMCPSYRATRDEKDSTRGRARVLQELVNGTDPLVGGWGSPEVEEALDLCLACKGCSSDCPSGVDMATYKAEALHQRYRGRLRPASHYALGRLPVWSRMASLAPGLANRAVAGPLGAIAKRVAGVDARREMPAFAPRTFRRWFRDRQATGVGPSGASSAGGDPVLLWVDTFTDHYTPQVGMAAVRVLEDAGYTVRITERKLCCGLTWISTGQLDAARRILGRSVAALAPHAEAGVPIVGLEPSCTAVFRGDAAELLGGSARAVAEATRTLAELLSAREGWTPPALEGTEVVAQPHCHHHAVMGWSTDRKLLESAGASVRTIEGCCGLAGNFGAERGHYDTSVAVAGTALLPAVREAPQDAQLLTDGFSCRTQLAQLARREGTHLAELLAAHLG
ncbi:FAD-binding and (Fe-S)-binding domain-containing protein [Streptomyces iconiensis]|uniref:FAD-linked oxidase C-terminal domain-containing protein n=1 Tax=Streptomyces iconiensis TaxID=1384038 RepID=A0ABT7A104_9ACTN|nr:FAD-binding and (Fe-S)-binding domain-containing protein [Streptomyces iconiensis]MDJ1135015.1 FAD-linked oxidase C-terminal domain-containing protein [Streptomyces iconiensis]